MNIVIYLSELANRIDILSKMGYNTTQGYSDRVRISILERKAAICRYLHMYQRKLIDLYKLSEVPESFIREPWEHNVWKDLNFASFEEERLVRDILHTVYLTAKSIDKKYSEDIKYRSEPKAPTEIYSEMPSINLEKSSEEEANESEKPSEKITIISNEWLTLSAPKEFTSKQLKALYKIGIIMTDILSDPVHKGNWLHQFSAVANKLINGRTIKFPPEIEKVDTAQKARIRIKKINRKKR